MSDENGILPAVSDLDGIIPATSLGLSRLGWVAPTDHVSFDQWAAIIEAALAVERASPFWVGDLFIYAQSQGKDFEDRALQALPYKDQTVRNYAVVCRVFDRTKRWPSLSIRHHAVMVAKARKDMADAQKWLEWAECTKSSVTELVEATTQALAVTSEAPETNPSATSDWRDLLLAEAAKIIEMHKYQPSIDVIHEAEDWLKRYAEKIAK